MCNPCRNLPGLSGISRQSRFGEVAVGYSRILVANDIDEPSSWKNSVPVALVLGKCFGARIALGYVTPDLQLEVKAQWSGLALGRLIETADARLRLISNEVGEGQENATHVATGRVFRGILEIANTIDADLIVLASHRPQMKDFLIGENAERMIRHARPTVMVVRD